MRFPPVKQKVQSYPHNSYSIYTSMKNWVPLITPVCFLRHCLADLNCLTMTFNESSSKTKNNTAVSLGAPLALYIFSWTVSFRSYVPSWFYFEILRGQRFGPATLRSALWRVELSPLYWTEILAGPTGMCRGERLQTLNWGFDRNVWRWNKSTNN